MADDIDVEAMLEAPYRKDEVSLLRRQPFHPLAARGCGGKDCVCSPIFELPWNVDYMSSVFTGGGFGMVFLWDYL